MDFRDFWEPGGVLIMFSSKEYCLFRYTSIRRIFSEENVKFWHWSLKNLDLDNCVTDHDCLLYYERREILRNLLEIYYELFY